MPLLKKLPDYFGLEPENKSELVYIGCGRTLGAVDHIKFNFITFVQGFKAVALNCGIMDKDIFPLFLFDKTKTL